MALIANVNRDSKKRAKPYTAQDFAWDGKKAKNVATTDEEIYEMLRAAFPPEDN